MYYYYRRCLTREERRLKRRGRRRAAVGCCAILLVAFGLLHGWQARLTGDSQKANPVVLNRNPDNFPVATMLGAASSRQKPVA